MEIQDYRKKLIEYQLLFPSSASILKTMEEMLGEMDKLVKDCNNAYQVIGAMDFNEDISEATVIRMLDNLYAASSGSERPHEEVFPKPF